jgi:site-specific recombinase XerD
MGSGALLVDRERVCRWFNAIEGVDLDPIALLDALAVAESAGFVLDDYMRPVEPVTRFLIEMAGEVSERTRRECSLDLFALARFLEAAGTNLVDACEHELMAHRRWRREGQDRPVARKTWQRNRAPIERFYDWLVENGHRDKRPYRPRRGRGGTTTLSDPMHEEQEIRHLTVDQWLFFRDVGLGGLLPDGSADPAYYGRAPLRNTVAAETALATGMRMQEWSTMLDVEAPVPSMLATTSAFRLEECAKGRRPRVVTLRDPVLRRIDLYRRSERAAIVYEVAPGLARRGRELFVVASMDASRRLLTGTLDGRRRSFDWARMGPALRRRTVIEGDRGLEPLALFLGEHGHMMSRSRWCRLIGEGSSRVQRFAGSGAGPTMPGRISSHDFRHTFAVMMLTALMRAVIDREGLARDRSGVWVGYRHLLENPLLRLQRLLGHAHVGSTYGYLRYLDDSDALVQDAFDRRYDADRTFADFAAEELADAAQG